MGPGTQIGDPPLGNQITKNWSTFANWDSSELVKTRSISVLQGMEDRMDLCLLQAMFVLIQVNQQ